MTLAARTQALLDLVEQERQRQCGALLAEAHAQAAALQADSRVQARQRMREAFAEERARSQARLNAVRAELQTRRRVHAQRRLEALLVLAWQQLPAALDERWRAAAPRAAWVAMALGQARRALAPGPWQVTHAPGWPQSEREACAVPPLALHFESDERIGAGLRVAAAGNVVDATREGLLADRDEIGGRLVGLLEAG